MARHIETGWLIENHAGFNGTKESRWFAITRDGVGWVVEKDKALRFARAEDALRFRSTLDGEQHMSVSEHEWVAR